MKGALNESLQWVWDARWASYWVGDEEYFAESDEPFERKAKELKNAGVNSVITFGGFHFRWSFVDEWPELLLTLKLWN